MKNNNHVSNHKSSDNVYVGLGWLNYLKGGNGGKMTTEMYKVRSIDGE